MLIRISRLLAGFFLQIALVSSVTWADTSAEAALDPEWLALGHYQKNSVLSGYNSFIDTPEFFLAPDGKSNPGRELVATIKAFEKSGSKIYCKYPARLTFLQRKFKKFKKFNLAECSDFHEWQGLIDAKGVSLIFPASFLNNPASAFGHTFLRLDQDPENPKADYYSYTVNFSAHTFGEPGLIYAFKGIFGFYNGYFKVVPYFEMVKLYSDLEKRDIWEYRLNFQQSEIDFLVKHLWELRSINFNYYYFDENCSYHLLGLIDVLRPSLRLRDRFATWVIPSDTMKAIASNPTLVKETTYRPSLSAKFKAREAASSISSKKLAKTAIEQRNSDSIADANWELAEKIATFDLAYDYLDYLVVGDKIPAEESDPLAFKILNQRSALQLSSPEIVVPKPADPLHSHASQRLGYGGLYRDNHYYQSFDLRLAYHDLLDPQDGFVPGSQINFIDLNILLKDQQLSLDRLTVIDLVSLSPGNYFLKPLSWSLSTGLKREDFNFSEDQELIYKNELLLGLSKEINAAQQLYLLVGAVNKLSTHLESNQATGGGFKLGWLAYAKHFNYLTELSYNEYLFGDQHHSIRFATKFNVPIDQDWNVRLELARQQDYERIYNSYLLNLFYYF